MYSKTQQKFLLKLARDAIKNRLFTGRNLKIDESKINEQLKENRGVFVTITIGSQLRGCIGHIVPVQELYKDVAENAINAAFDDPRFYPLSKDELDLIKIEISILSLPQKIDYKNTQDLLSKITPLKDGIILKKGFFQATYLPQVWEDLTDKNAFLSSLCLKAGLPSDEWKTGTLEVSRYSVEKFEEN